MVVGGPTCGAVVMGGSVVRPQVVVVGGPTWGVSHVPGRLPRKTAIGIVREILLTYQRCTCDCKLSLEEKTETTVGNEMIMTM